MKKLFLALLALAAFSSPAQAQWVVIDPSNLMQNIMNVMSTVKQEITSAQQLANQYRQLEYDLMQLKKMASGDVSGLFGTVQAALDSQRHYIDQVQGLYGDLTNAKRMADDMYRRIGASGKSADEWFQLAADLNKATQEGDGFFTHHQADLLKQVGRRYEEVQNLQGKITQTEGTHESMQLMNSQMNVLLATMNQALEQNAVVAQRSAYRDMQATAMEKRGIDEQAAWRDAVKAARQKDEAALQRLAPATK